MFSSNPTVETKYPRVQPFSPVKFFWRLPNFLAMSNVAQDATASISRRS